MSYYKKGDKVTIRKDLLPYHYYGAYDVADEMLKHAGKEAIITGIHDSFGIHTYTINLDNGVFGWTAQMFEIKRKRNEQFVCSDIWGN